LTLLFGMVIIAFIFILLAGIAFKGWHQAKQQHYLLTKKTNELTLSQTNQENLLQKLNALKIQLHDAMQDSLTQLPAWAFFEDRIKHSLHESARHQLSMAVLYIDLNNFKLINQALSYELGDAVLLEVSRRLQECIRQVDSVARFSKDVFVVLLTQLSKPEMAAIAAQRILESLTQPIQINEHQLYITACIGISIYPNDALEAASLFSNAEQALLLAKKKNYQNYQFYQESLHTNSLRELALSTGLNSESLFNELEINYQPIMNAETQTIFCMQTSLCWRHPQLGLIQGDELLGYAQQQNKLDALCVFLLKQACQKFSAWQDEGLQLQLLSIPFSIRQFEHPQFIYRISQLLQECNFKPDCLLLEIKSNTNININAKINGEKKANANANTNTNAKINDNGKTSGYAKATRAELSFDVAEKALNMLHYLNIKLAIDNFGMSEFSIQDLKKLKVNYIKLAAELISDLEQNQQTRELAKAMVLLAKSLSAQVIVSAVNSEDQMKILSGLGCELMQGDYISAAKSLELQ
jgi:diguanylate cyclase (GGDEF)-like protein